ncbi:uncharacterized protein PV09_08015 [Verruconis gallopava]|uniref:Ribonuclease P/MRP protein subunit POP5 n=1 Tax=Verruconis gallopava TaxID=253628 RepID=A0A0D2AN06_9PEZI|nr:uncharacterized protein PV09_08015 [Verruconis gallopava]KIW00494.1 hypothetical protein PV09_08015 [Verruconis gallopava]
MVRLKHRYLLVNILYPSNGSVLVHAQDEEVNNFLRIHAPSPPKFDERSLVMLIRNSVSEMFGDYGVGKVSGSLKVVYFSAATSSAIIRVSREHVRLVWAALTFVTHLPKAFGTPCVIHVVRNSGTIRLAESEAIKRARDLVRRARASNQRDGLEQVLKNAVQAEERESATMSVDEELTSGDE